MKDKFSKLLQENLKKEQEKKWDNRFFLYKIPQYDAFKDPNYISLSLMKTKTKYDEKNAKKNEANLKKRIYSTHYSINSLNKKNPSQNKLHHEDSFQRNQLNQKRPKSIYMNRNKLSFTNGASNNNIFSKYITDKLKNQNEYNSEFYNYNNIYNSKTTKNKDVNHLLIKDYSNQETKNNSIINNDDNLLEELNIIKEVWNEICVTEEYQNSFEEMINKMNDKERIENILYNEKKQINQFRTELLKLLKVIKKREETIQKIKKLDLIFIQNKELTEINKKNNNQKIKIKSKSDIYKFKY